MRGASSDVLIVGAGIAGLMCATELQQRGLSVCVIDKGRGVGGRMSTRRIAGGRLDHGAQFFTVRDARFAAYAQQWLEAGVIREWYRSVPGSDSGNDHPRYCGIHGMSEVPKYLARSLNVQTSQCVTSVVRDVDHWLLQTEQGATFAAQQLIVTTPLPQALMLMETSGLDWSKGQLEQFRALHYEQGLATLVILDQPSAVPYPGALKVEQGPLTWIADNQQKGISPDVTGLTLHASAAFAAQHWDSPNELRGQLMIDAARPFFPGARVLEYQCHRWGFTLPLNPWPERCFHSPDLQLTLAGDAFGGPRIEGAALSGIEAAAQVGELV